MEKGSPETQLEIKGYTLMPLPTIYAGFGEVLELSGNET
jgi:hypothetical protein